MKRIVVTGASKRGFLGQHVKKAFSPYKAYGPEDVTRHYIMYTGSEYDLVKQPNVDSLFIDLQPDIVVHMAAVCGGILANKNSPADFLRDNTQMSLNIYEAARRFGCKRVYTLGSVCAYPKHCPVPFKEDDLFNGYPEETNAPYGQSKRTLMMLGQTYREQYGVGGAHLIPVNMYGEHDHFDLVNSHVIPALIHKFLNPETCAQPVAGIDMGDVTMAIPVWGTGNISIKDLAYLIRKLTECKNEIMFTGDVSDGQPERRLDVTRAKEMLGFTAKTNLEEGLKKTIEWYKEQSNATT
jgi:GDP-L-fucose synthase